jgi:hypothetical protein
MLCQLILGFNKENHAQNGFSEIISRLKQQQIAIDEALEALRELDGVDSDASATETAAASNG